MAGGHRAEGPCLTFWDPIRPAEPWLSAHTWAAAGEFDWLSPCAWRRTSNRADPRWPAVLRMNANLISFPDLVAEGSAKYSIKLNKTNAGTANGPPMGQHTAPN